MSDISTAVADEVRAVFAAELALDRDRVSLTTTLASLAGLDSVKLLRIVAALETEYGISLDDDRLYDLKEVRDVAALVEEERAVTSLAAGE